MATLHDGNYKVVDNVIDLEHTTAEAYITQDTSFKLENIRNGRKCIVAVKNGDSVDHSVTFIGAGIDPNDATKTIAANTYTLYNLTCSVDGVFVCICSENSSGPFPSGADGDLIVHDTETVTLSAGRIYDYNTVLIETGGTVIIDDTNNEANLTEIYAKSFTIDGQIIGRSLFITQDINKQVTTGLGESLIVTYSLANGGNGGKGANTTYNCQENAVHYGGAGGSGVKAFGGGGGGGAAMGHNGASGGTNNGNGGNSYGSTGGTGGTGNAQNGYNASGNEGGNGGNGCGSGGASGCDGSYSSAAGGSGGGGCIGNSGLPLYLYSSNAISGNGLIDLSGSNGSNGGSGGTGSSYGVGGSGGGGGPGGNGGALFVNTPANSVAYNISGGSGGNGGSGGYGPNCAANGNSGQNGQNGNNGTYTEL